MSGSYTAPNISPARALSPHIGSTRDVNSMYLAELLEEHQKLVPFTQVLPFCNRLLNQEILRVSALVRSQGYNDLDMLYCRSPSPMPASDMIPNSRGIGLNGWGAMQHEKLGGPHGMNIDFPAAQTSPNSHIMKKIMRLEIPVDMYPTFNFVGRLLGPRGNSLKRLEASTGCRVFIRGKGSIKDTEKEDILRGKPGYEHLNDPLHILVEAELPADIIDMRLRHAQELLQELLTPVDESQDLYKRQQLRELAMLNSNPREESPCLGGSISPFSSPGMKRAKTGQ